MKQYELTYLISPDLSDKEADSFSIEIASLVQEKQGILEKNLSLLKKQLGYPIKKKMVAYLAGLNFQINPEGLEELKKQIKSESRILRYLILTKEPPKKIVKTLITREGRKEGESFFDKKPKRVIKPKVELKEIEKKLEEILKNE